MKTLNLRYLCALLMRFFRLYILLACLITASCNSQYKDILNGSDMDAKYTHAVELYEKGEYFKALPLLEDLLTAWRGLPKAEKAYYYYAYTQYNLKNYKLASFHFKNYADSYQGTPKAEETEFMHAQCLYYDSPESSLDQGSTTRAMDAFQLYMNRYPNSERVAECNESIDELRLKLQEKSFDTAILFYKMEDYRAAAAMFEQTLKEFPDIDEREELEFLILQSNFEFAKASITSKQEERYENAIKLATAFEARYPESKDLKEVGKVIKGSEKGILNAQKEIKEAEEEEVILEIF